MKQDPESRLKELGITLPPAPQPLGAYRPAMIAGGMIYTSGHLPIREDGTLVKGKVGETLSLEEGIEAARLAGLSILATLEKELGTLKSVKRLVKTLGFVNCVDSFEAQPKIINGCSELFAEVFGPEFGIGVRSAVGVNSLPAGIAVEIEAVFEIEIA
jgi:enamine deaminase RidA (YjgF/YER057c/UK114 family)